MAHLLYCLYVTLFICGFTFLKGRIKNHLYAFFSNAIGQVLGVRNKSSSPFFECQPFFKASVFGLHEMACVLKAKINPQPNRPCNIKEADRFKKRAELYPNKRLSKSRAFYTINFKRLPNSKIRVYTFFPLSCL